MSRVGKKPIDIPNNVKVDIKGNNITVEGPKGKLEYTVPGGLSVSLKENKLIVGRSSSLKKELSLHGLTRSIISNLIKGVTDGYAKELEIKGVGFKAAVQGNILQINVGFSHAVRYAIPEGITIKTAKPTKISITGIDKVKVGETAAEIRDYFKPEPYKGKGIRYLGEYVRHKAGKTVVK
ncbi:MAG: 50S ribosomal protein L6 [Candidatus Omnitrophota bacterium]|nr:MAG: 50S ribosomal protein L6 [Candidatus Omnitrophota bacterium]